MIKNVIFDVGRVLAAYDYQSYLNRKNYSEEEQKIIKKAMFESQTWLLADRGEVPEGKLLELFVNNDPNHEELIRDAYEHMEEVIWLFPYTMQWVKDIKERERVTRSMCCLIMERNYLRGQKVNLNFFHIWTELYFHMRVIS